MQTYKLGSSAMIHAPGMVAFAINGYRWERSRRDMLEIITLGWGVPETAAKALLSQRVGYTIEDDAVVFTVEVK